MEFIPYCAEEAFKFCFYQIPKELFTNEYYKGKLSSSTILLYGLLLDRLSLSIKNKYKLINEKRIGKGKTYKIYVGKVNCKKSDLSIGNFTAELPEKVRHSKIANKRFELLMKKFNYMGQLAPIPILNEMLK